MSEDDLLRAVLALAKLYGWRTLHIRPARTEKGWRSPVQGDGKGWPDLFMIRGDDVLAIELKGATGKLTDEQRAWLDALMPIAWDACVWRPEDWTSGRIMRALKGVNP